MFVYELKWLWVGFPLAVTYTSDIAPVSSNEFLDIQVTIECGFTSKQVRSMIKHTVSRIPQTLYKFYACTYSQNSISVKSCSVQLNNNDHDDSNNDSNNHNYSNNNSFIFCFVLFFSVFNFVISLVLLIILFNPFLVLFCLFYMVYLLLVLVLVLDFWFIIHMIQKRFSLKV